MDERLWHLLLAVGISLDFAGAVLVLSAVIDFSSRKAHGQLKSAVDYIDTELAKARSKAIVGLYLICAGVVPGLLDQLRKLL